MQPYMSLFNWLGGGTFFLSFPSFLPSFLLSLLPSFFHSFCFSYSFFPFFQFYWAIIDYNWHTALYKLKVDSKWLDLHREMILTISLVNIIILYRYSFFLMMRTLLKTSYITYIVLIIFIMVCTLSLVFFIF